MITNKVAILRIPPNIAVLFQHWKAFTWIIFLFSKAKYNFVVGKSRYPRYQYYQYFMNWPSTNHTWLSRSLNSLSLLLSSTRLSHVISSIHLQGLGCTWFKSRAAPAFTNTCHNDAYDTSEIATTDRNLKSSNNNFFATLFQGFGVETIKNEALYFKCKALPWTILLIFFKSLTSKWLKPSDAYLLISLDDTTKLFC